MMRIWRSLASLRSSGQARRIGAAATAVLAETGSAVGGRTMIEVRRLGHATLTTPDLARQVAYYTEVVGLTLLERDTKRALLASKQGFEAVALAPRAPNALSPLPVHSAPGNALRDLPPALA